jgi:putative addiction module CopG family antidote
LAILANFCHKIESKFHAKSGDVTMATMNISIPDPMKDWVQAQVETGAYANSSDYVRDLIRKGQENRNKQIIQKAITEWFGKRNE